MLRIPAAAIAIALAACGSSQEPVQSASAPSQLFRGGQGEVRLRCGSDTLRAKLREGRLVVQLGAGESAVLVPVDDPRAKAGQAYGDGKLTLYRMGGPEGWMLARSDGPAAAACKPAAAGN